MFLEGVRLLTDHTFKVTGIALERSMEAKVGGYARACVFSAILKMSFSLKITFLK